MKGVFLVVVFLCLEGALAGFTSRGRPKPALSYAGALGSECEYDEDCMTHHSFCRSNRVCDCKKKYQYDEDSDTCYPTQLGLRCNSNDDCVMDNSWCQEETCQCRQGYVAPEGAQGCLPLSRLQASCQSDAQCVAADTNSFCNINTRTCDCKDAFHPAWDTQQCTPNKQLRETCTTHASCASVPEQQDKVECRPDNDGRSKCFCKSGFTEQRNICARGLGYDGGSSTILVSVSCIILTTLIHFFK